MFVELRQRSRRAEICRRSREQLEFVVDVDHEVVEAIAESAGDPFGLGVTAQQRHHSQSGVGAVLANHLGQRMLTGDTQVDVNEEHLRCERDAHLDDFFGVVGLQGVPAIAAQQLDHARAPAGIDERDDDNRSLLVVFARRRTGPQLGRGQIAHVEPRHHRVGGLAVLAVAPDVRLVSPAGGHDGCRRAKRSAA